MPATLKFEEPCTFVTTAWGHLTYADAKGSIDATLAHPRFGPGCDALFDGTDVNTVPSTAELRTLAADLKPLRDAGLSAVALVAGSNFTFGVARMFSAFAEAFGAKVGAFRSVEDARAWLAEVHATL